jgi:hypothetical protein
MRHAYGEFLPYPVRAVESEDLTTISGRRSSGSLGGQQERALKRGERMISEAEETADIERRTGGM